MARTVIDIIVVFVWKFGQEQKIRHSPIIQIHNLAKKYCLATIFTFVVTNTL